MTDTDWKELIGARVLIHPSPYRSEILEVKVLEFSPSGDYIKLDFSANNSGINWCKTENIILLEVLEVDKNE